ncbi:MAG: MBL fold metallo-hydrolase [Cyclobacteriaceae bacterium]
MKQLLIIALLLLSQPLLAQSDQIPAKKGDITIHPVLHSSMVLEWDGKTIFVDPYGGGEMFTAYGAPDLVLITDIHGDHLHRETLAALDLSGAELIAPQAVVEQVEDLNFQKASSLVNGKQANWQAVKVEAIPMYNLPETEDSRHPKGRGNGYVLTLGGKRIYISGDTEDIPEMRKLKNIDVAFVCMNLPYTMDVQQAADAVLDFKPAIVYPFHYRGGGGKFSDVEEFKRLVEAGNEEIEVRLASWYPAN